MLGFSRDTEPIERERERVRVCAHVVIMEAKAQDLQLASCRPRKPMMWFWSRGGQALDPRRSHISTECEDRKEPPSQLKTVRQGVSHLPLGGSALSSVSSRVA